MSNSWYGFVMNESCQCNFFSCNGRVTGLVFRETSCILTLVRSLALFHMGNFLRKIGKHIFRRYYYTSDEKPVGKRYSESYWQAFLNCVLSIFFNDQFNRVRLQITFADMSCCKSAGGQDENSKAVWQIWETV